MVLDPDLILGLADPATSRCRFDGYILGRPVLLGLPIQILLESVLVLEGTLALLVIITRLLLLMLGVLVRLRGTRRGGTGIVHGLCVRVVVVAGELCAAGCRDAVGAGWVP